MKSLKYLITALLLVSSLTTLLASCSKKNTEEETEAETVVETVEETETEWSVTPEDPDVNNLFHFGMTPVKYDNAYGYVGADGEFVIKNIFDDAKPFAYNGYAWVKVGDQWGVINTTGAYVLLPQFELPEPNGNFNPDGLTIAGNNNKYGYINPDGSFAVYPQFEWVDTEVHPFTNLTLVRVAGKYGFVNAEGVYVVNPQYDYVDKEATAYINGLKVAMDGKYGFLNADCSTMVAIKYDYISSEVDEYTGYLVTRCDGKYGFLTSSATTVLDARLDEIYNVHEYTGLLKVRENGKYGLLSKTCEYVLPANYTSIANDVDEYVGYVRVANNDTESYGYINQEAKVIIPVRNYRSFTKLEDGSFSFSARVNSYYYSETRYGYLNLEENISIAPSYYAPFSFKNGYAFVKNSFDSYDIINKNGNQTNTMTTSFASVSPFSKNGRALVVAIDGTRGYIDTKGEFVLIIANYDSTVIDGSAYTDNGLARVRLQSGDYAYINAQGEIVSSNYRTASDFVNGCAVVGVNYSYSSTTYGLLNAYGGEALPCEYTSIDLATDEEGNFLGIVKATKDDVCEFYSVSNTGSVSRMFQLQTSNYYGISNFNKHGVLGAVVHVETVDEWGRPTTITKRILLNKSGSIVTGSRYDSIAMINNELGWYAVEIGDSQGLITAAGQQLLATSYNSISLGDFGDNDMALISVVTIDTYGESNRLYGLIDKTGKFVVAAQYASVEVLDNGMIRVSKRVSSEDGYTQQYGLLDAAGKQIFAPAYDGISISEMDEVTNLIRVSVLTNGERRYGLINAEGTVVANPEYDIIGEFGNVYEDEEGKEALYLTVIRKDGLYGVMDATGAIKIQPKFDNILSYFDDHGRAQVVKNGAVGIIGTDSEYIINPQFSSISECYEDGYYVVTVGNTAVGIIDASGKYVVSPRFEN